MGTRRTVLVTRPEPEARETADALSARGIESLRWPLTEIHLTAPRVEVPANTQALLFTSINGVRAFALLSAGRELPVLAVGERTGAEARRAGFGSVETAEGDVESLARLAVRHGTRRMFHAHGREVAGDLAGALAAQGITVARQVLYAAEETGPAPGDVFAALEAGDIGIVGIWSPRNARILTRRLVDLAPAARAAVSAVAISEAAAMALHGFGFAAVHVAPAPSGGAILAEIERRLAEVDVCLRR